MPAIITRESSQRRLGDFVNTVKNDRALYFGLGKRSTTWVGSPDEIADTPQEKIDFWDELLGVKKVAIKDIIPMIPERKWISGVPYVVFDPSKEQAYDDAFYVINSKYEVFVCTTAGGGNSTDEPLLEDTDVNGDVTTADGYSWSYMFGANRYEYQQTPAGWMSVNYGSSIDDADLKQNQDAFIILGTRYLLCRGVVQDPVTSGEFTQGAFRQIGLISHPRLTNDDLAINTYEDVANLKLYSGYLLYLENRDQEDIIDGQNTDLKITLRF